MFSLSAVKWSTPARLLVIVISLLLITPADLSEFKELTLASFSSELSDQLDRIARSITVKISAKDQLGSGIMVGKEGSVYTVITNRHVLRAGNPPYQINTNDGKIHQAEVIDRFNFAKYDLALLQFNSEKDTYNIAALGNSSQLTVGDEVFAAGFPHSSNVKNYTAVTPTPTQADLKIRPGRVSIVLDQNLEEGYQIGYTNDLEKGMSGGPLLNDRGELVGVNGKHAYPLWDAPDLYEDGSQPCQPLQDLINHSSLAIPIEKVLKLTPNLAQTKNDNLSGDLTNVKIQPINTDSDKKQSIPEPVLRMKAIAEAKKKCTDLPPKSGSSGARIEL
ncbi:MAG: S1 family peptidase [Xenococcaceae cyanobacterium]